VGSWEDVQAFVRRLNERDVAGGWVYRLPTEEEWEYACRGAAGSREECAFEFDLDRPSNDLSSTQANFNGSYPAGSAPRGPWLGRTTQVGSYQPNRLGLHDLHGNVGEWTGTTQDSVWMIRGGGWLFRGSECGAAAQDWDPPSRMHSCVGFRLALGPSGTDGG
jgi:formylglycine-generating enzyme required for sulfatase activity